MFDGKIAVFNGLYKYLYDEYRGGDSERQVFNTVERSFVLRDVDNLDPNLFPWLFLMWGRSEPTDAPRTGEFGLQLRDSCDCDDVCGRFQAGRLIRQPGRCT